MRSIVHINIIHFYVAVARMLEPKLSGYPVGVRAAGSRRILVDVSDEAIVAGCTGMPLEAAKRKCPDLRVTDPVPYNRVEQFLLKQASQLLLWHKLLVRAIFSGSHRHRPPSWPGIRLADSVRKLIRECSTIARSAG